MLRRENDIDRLFQRDQLARRSFPGLAAASHFDSARSCLAPGLKGTKRRSDRALPSINSRGLLPIISTPPRASRDQLAVDIGLELLTDLIGDAVLSELFTRPWPVPRPQNHPHVIQRVWLITPSSGLSYSSDMSLLV
jgi:hypothetical protein